MNNLLTLGVHSFTSRGASLLVQNLKKEVQMLKAQVTTFKELGSSMTRLSVPQSDRPTVVSLGEHCILFAQEVK